MTPSDLKFHVRQRPGGSHFFTRNNMSFAGDTMRNYGVRSKPVDVTTQSGDVVPCWELYRRRPVKHGVSGSAFFAVDGYRQVFPDRS